jgi:putative RecB family exonuclease
MTLFSHSRLSCFEKCPLKFRFKYIDKLESPREQGVEAFLGSLVHSTLEKLYKDLRFKKLNTLDELLKWFREEWKRNWSSDILIVRKQFTQENYRKMAEDYIRDYYKRYKPFDQNRTIALEEKVMITLDPEGRYRLQGYIDRLAYAGKGVYEIHDYKTNFNIPIKQYIDDDRQLALYALAVLNNYQDARSVRLVWHFLSADKEVVIEKTQEELDKLKADTIKLIDSIKAERDFPPRPGPLCNWCEFRPECPAQKHLVKVESLPPNRYLKEPGVKLVNRYAELKKKEKDFMEEIGEELDQVKEALFRYAEKEGLQVVAGSGVTARIWSKDCIKFPGKKDPGREELEELIRSSGQWDKSSMLDTWELERLVSGGRLPQGLIKKLSKFARREMIQKIYLKRANSQ